MTSPQNKRAHVVGLGLIGASLALALTRAGWSVTGADVNESVWREAVRRGVVSEGNFDGDVTLAFVATPAGAVVESATSLLTASNRHDLIVTDVAGVKENIVAAISDPRFLAGHPMAGSELRGFDGARADLFEGCTWVLSPTPGTTVETYALLLSTLRELGASVVAVSGADHDRLVAVASHVPHLVAGALMNEATVVAEEDAVLLQLAAGGFRDMTRIAAGDPAIWPDILVENAHAISSTLQNLENRLRSLRLAIEAADRSQLSETLAQASLARRQLPGRALQSDQLAYLRVGVSDKPGQLSVVTQLAADSSVNIYDIEIAHKIDATGGTLLLAIDERQSAEFGEALRARGFSVGRQ